MGNLRPIIRESLESLALTRSQATDPKVLNDSMGIPFANIELIQGVGNGSRHPGLIVC